jgi:sigma-B regulation protein RsbU (phosphoserine phosphatase)
MFAEDKKVVLVIDDDLTIRKLISFHLKKKDYLVHEADGSAEAFEILNSQKIDLALCDVNMDGMDGFTFCQKVRENELYRTLPFIFVTAKTSIEDKEKALSVGGDDIVSKPFDVQELLLKVQALIRRSEIYKSYSAKKAINQPTAADETEKILLVDDDISLSKLFQYNLSKAGFDCKIANNALDGLKLAKSFMPDVIISDIMMPEIDGYEFRKMILADSELRPIPFLFLTAKGGEDDILVGYELGITDYVLKTAGPRVVVAKVSAIVKSLRKERQKVFSELHKAADSLRVKVVPDNFPNFSKFEIKHWHIPFKGIPGGDFIDYFQIDDEQMVIVLGDVMGKKWGAWYFAVAYVGYVRSAIRVALQTLNEYSPQKILEQVNRSIYQDSKISEVFATLSILVINNKTNTVKYSGAGDLPILLRKFSNKSAELIQSSGMLLGFSEDGSFKDKEFNISPNDFIIIFTDGVIESRNIKGEPIGTENLLKIVSSTPDNVDTLEYLKANICTFTNQSFEDDISLIFVKAI